MYQFVLMSEECSSRKLVKEEGSQDKGEHHCRPHATYTGIMLSLLCMECAVCVLGGDAVPFLAIAFENTACADHHCDNSISRRQHGDIAPFGSVYHASTTTDIHTDIQMSSAHACCQVHTMAVFARFLPSRFVTMHHIVLMEEESLCCAFCCRIHPHEHVVLGWSHLSRAECAAGCDRYS